MIFTKSQMAERKKELNFYNLMGVMNTSLLMYETFFTLSPYCMKEFGGNEEDAKKWCVKSAQSLIDKLHFGQVEWTFGDLGSRWCDMKFGDKNTRVSFYSKKSDKCHLPGPSKYMIMFEPISM